MGHPAPESASVAHRGAGTALPTVGATPAPGGPQQELGHLGAATSGWTVGVASHQERCPMRRRVSGTGPEVCSCGASARFPAGCCPSVVLSVCLCRQSPSGGLSGSSGQGGRLAATSLPQPPGSLIVTNRRCDIRCHNGGCRASPGLERPPSTCSCVERIVDHQHDPHPGVAGGRCQ